MLGSTSFRNPRARDSGAAAILCFVAVLMAPIGVESQQLRYDREYPAVDYYAASSQINDWLLANYGHTAETIGGHAGIRDISQLLYVAPQHIRTDKLAPLGGGEGMGVTGDPTLASAEKGRQGIQMKVDAAVKQIRELMGR